MNALFVAWFPLVFTIGNALAQFPASKLGLRFGRKKILLGGIATVIVACLIMGSATNGLWLMTGRLLQGLGHATIIAICLSLLADTEDTQKRTSLLGAFLSSAYLGITCGPLMGSTLIAEFGWRAAFLLPGALLVMMWILAYQLLPTAGSREADTGFDYRGLLIYSLFILLLAPGLKMLPSTGAVLALIAAGIAAVMLYKDQRSKQQGLISIGMFSENRPALKAVFALVSLHSALYAIPFVMLLHLQYIADLPIQTIGLILIVGTATTAAISPFSGRYVSRFGELPVMVTACSAVILGLILLLQLKPDSEIWVVICALSVLGLGVGLMESPLMNRVFNLVEERYRSSASSTINSTRMFGSFFSVAVISLFISLNLGNEMLSSDLAHEIATAVRYFFAVAICLMIAAGFLILRGSNSRKSIKHD